MEALCTKQKSISVKKYLALDGLLKISHKFVITIIAVSLFACESETTKDPAPISGANKAPNAAINPNVNQAINSGDSISFDANASSDPDGNTPLSYNWQFPGGIPTSSTSKIPGAVLFQNVGTYTISLQVTDSLNLASAVRTIFVTVNDPSQVNNQTPIAIINPATAQTIIKGSSINFIGDSSNDPDNNTPLSYAWTFNGATPAMSSEPNPVNVSYNNAGTYQATLQVIDSLGKVSLPTEITINVTEPVIVNQAPNGDITNPVSDANNIVHVTVGNSLNYSASANDPDGDAMTYVWSLAGGTPANSTSLNPGNVLYEIEGTYTSTFTVTDAFMNVDPTPDELTIVVDPTPPAGNAKVISIIVMNDLHAHLLPHDDLKRNSDGTSVVVKNRGGLARIATKIKQIRAENPNNILVNIGDTYHGGVEAFFSEGNDIVTAVNNLLIDVAVPGNWDFAYGPNVTRTRFTTETPFLFPIRTIEKPQHQINLAANLFQAGTNQTLMPATTTIAVAGINIGIIGITSDMVPSMSPILSNGMDFTQGEAAYVDLINGLTTGLRNASPPADIVVVLSELGIHKDKRLADLIPMNSVDVFFSAHTHELTTTPQTSISGALVVEAGNDTYLGRMDITISGTSNSFNWNIIPIDASIAEDANMLSKIQTARAPYVANNVNLAFPGLAQISTQTLQVPIDTVLTTTSHLLSRRHSLENSFNNLMTDLLLAGTGTDLAVTTGFRFDSVIAEKDYMYVEDQSVASGAITVEDIYRFFPAPYNIATAKVTGQVLKQVIETNLSRVYSNNVFEQTGGWTDGYAGLIIETDLSKGNGNRVSKLTLKKDGSNINLTDNITTFTITGCTRPVELSPSTFCTNGTGFTEVLPLTPEQTAVDFLIGTLQNNADITGFPARQDVIDTNNTPLWPLSEFIQPITGLP